MVLLDNILLPSRAPLNFERQAYEMAEAMLPPDFPDDGDVSFSNTFLSDCVSSRNKLHD